MAPSGENIENRLRSIEEKMGNLSARFNSLLNVISGNDEVSGKQLSFGERLAKVEQTQKYLKVLLIGIGVGILIGGLIFGILTLKQVAEATKTMIK
jgi:tetrahydromethanopterin S-methyltransferase subunit B